MSGLPRLGLVCYRFVYAGTIKPNAVMPAHGLHSVRYLALLTWLIMFTARLDALPKPFRVACFRARRSTHAFRVLPNTVRRVQVLLLASCITLYIISLVKIAGMSAGRHTTAVCPAAVSASNHCC